MKSFNRWMLALGLSSWLAVALGHPPAPAVALSIPAQPLDQALNEFAQQTGLQVIFRADEVGSERTSKALSGSYVADEALKMLLADSGLQFKYLNEKTIAVRPRDNRASEAVRTDDGIRVAQAGGPSATTDPAAVGQAAGGEPRAAAGAQATKIEEVVVTAQKRAERLQNVPISISVLSGRDLDKSTAQGVTEALSTVPGVSITTSILGGGTQLAVRGVSAANPQFEGASPIAYYLDGVPFGLIKTAFLPDEDAYDLERIELLRGPQGTLYGASALNGVVRILTHDPDLQDFDFKARTSVSSTHDSGTNYRGDAAVNVPLVPGKLAARAVAGYQSLDGWIDTPDRQNVNDARLRNLRLKVEAQPTDAVSIGLSSWSVHNHYGAPSIGNDQHLNSSLLDQSIQSNFDTYGLKIGYQFSGFSLSSMSSYLDYENRGALDLGALLGFPYGLFTGARSHVFSQEVVLNSPHSEAWRWSIGGMYRRATENIDQHQVTASPSPTLYDDTSESFAGFGEVTRLFMGGRMELTAGLRHFQDHVTQMDRLAPSLPWIPASENFHATSPRAILNWHPRDHLTVYGSYSQGFRSGFPQNANVPAGFAPLLGDTLNNYELGAKGGFLDGRVELDSAVYYLDWRDVQQSLTVPFNGIPVTAMVNGKSASGIGVDFSLAVQPVRDLTLRVNFGWNDLAMDDAVLSGNVVLFEKGDRLNYSPKFTGGASADYVFAVGGGGFKGRLSASGNYTSDQTNRQILGNSVIVAAGDSIWITRASVSLDAPKNWTASLFVDNVGNARGTPLIGLYGVADWDLRLRPRTVGVQFEYHYQ